MEESKSKKPRKTQMDIVKELNILAENRLSLAEKVLQISDDTLKRRNKIDPEAELLLNKIAMLRWVMTSEYGDMKFGGESLVSKRVFDDDDMLSLKGKMLELIKKL